MNYLNALLALCSLWLGCSPTQKSTSPPLTLEQKIGQLLIVGFRGTSLSPDDYIVRDIRDRNIGGVVLYHLDLPSGRTMARNIASPQQLQALNRALQSHARTPLLVTIDQEGGRVNRLRTSFGFPYLGKSAQYLGQLDNADSTAHWAARTATVLAQAGVNMNFAPVVDVNVNPACPVIGALERSFGASPDLVAKHAGIVVEQHRQQRVLTSLKHFPGHGSATTDSHKGFTDVTATWTAHELLPYRKLLAEGKVDIVMTAHVINRQFDTLPATLSKAVISELLRKELGWDGVVISDDMQMGAIADNYGLDFALQHALNAGVDMLILSNNSPRAYQPEIAAEVIARIAALVRNGSIPEARIEEAYQRVQTLKSRL